MALGSTQPLTEIKTRVLCSVTFFPKNRAVYEIMWKKYGTAGRATDDKIIRRMGFSCWKTKATQNVQYLLLFHCNSGYGNSPQNYIIRTLPVLFIFVLSPRIA